MRVFELMNKLAELPAGAKIKTSIYVAEEMDLFKETSERTLCAGIAGVQLSPANDIVYLDTTDVEV